ncbi:MAG: OmpA family protein [Saprospiraceae bacterium]|nr:OmpA family protein [Candidatus Vicinibacter affinis]MBK7694728.1 OmpA family protein [Candidatus Vicinibacter affinis]MBK9640453.1 OmpA family protein [Candidatus Vicinibacter affinis]
MSRAIVSFTLAWFFMGLVNAQVDSAKAVNDRVAIQIDKTALWKSGKAKYPPKPKDVWELGIHGGHFLIDGDVDPLNPFSGFGVGLHLRRAIHYVFSIRLDATYSRSKGLETQPYGESLEPEQFYLEPKGQNRRVFDGYNRNNPWFPSYRTDYFGGSLQGVLNLGNLLFHKERNKWNWYLVLGFGAYHNRTMMDLRDANGADYQNIINRIGFTGDKFNTRQGRKEIKSDLKALYDGTYETEAFKKRGIFRVGDEYNVLFQFTGAVGVSRKINRRFNISLEHQLITSDNDYLDGIKWRSSTDQTNNNDIAHYTNLRLGINLGNLKKRTEPLYWLNPIDAVYDDIAALKQRAIFDPKDTDQDGVIDILDQETNSVPGAPVDTRGIAVDSDDDGIKDFKDKEPYSPPGYRTDSLGVAQIPVQPILTEGDVNKLVDNKLASSGLVGPDGKKACCPPDWFLPMVHFNLDEYCVKPQYYPQLHHVAEVMITYPDLKITAIGHTDVRNSNSYNNVLSYNRAKNAIEYIIDKYKIPRERFILMYGGEESPFGKKSNLHYINRRVEFRVSKKEDSEMARPPGPDAGDCNKKRVKKASNVKTDNGTDADKKSGY